MRAVVVSFDQFPMSLLGCYGNTEVNSPNFNRLASRAVVFDQHYAEDLSESPAHHAWWTGCYHFPRPHDDWIDRFPSLPRLLESRGVACRWFVNHSETSILPLPAACDVREFPQSDDAIEESIRSLQDQPNDRELLWLKLQESRWEDPADAVEQLDARLGRIWPAILRASEREPVLFVFTAARGLPLQNRPPNHAPPVFATEDSVHVPLIVFDSRFGQWERNASLTQPLDLPASLLTFFADGAPEPLEGRSFLPQPAKKTPVGRSFVTAGCATAWASIRDARFHLVRCSDADESRQTLFLKPEDVWDWHDVSSQAPEATQILSDQLDAFIAAAESGLPMPPAVVAANVEGDLP